jgi:folate-dependent phosphoribosylglycinamide formyltransferase PurN
MEDNPDLGKSYNVMGCLTDNPDCKGADMAENEYGLPVYKLSTAPFRERYGIHWRMPYFTRVSNILKEAGPDTILTTGFMLIAEDPFVSDWYGRVFNGHPANTSILRNEYTRPRDAGNYTAEEAMRMHRDGWKRMFTGDDAVTDAVMAGEEEIRTAVFFLDHGTDTGPNAVHSPPLKVDRGYVSKRLLDNDEAAVKQYARDLQERLKFEGDGPAIRETLKLASQGRLALSDEVLGLSGLPYQVYMDGEKLPYGGHMME